MFNLQGLAIFVLYVGGIVRAMTVAAVVKLWRGAAAMISRNHGRLRRPSCALILDARQPATSVGELTEKAAREAGLRCLQHLRRLRHDSKAACDRWR